MPLVWVSERDLSVRHAADELLAKYYRKPTEEEIAAERKKLEEKALHMSVEVDGLTLREVQEAIDQVPSSSRAAAYFEIDGGYSDYGYDDGPTHLDLNYKKEELSDEDREWIEARLKEWAASFRSYGAG